MRFQAGTRPASITAAGSVMSSAVVVLVASSVALEELRIAVLAAGTLASGLLVLGMLTGLARSIGPATGLLGACYVAAHLSGTAPSGAVLVIVATCLFLAADLAYSTGDVLRHRGTDAATRTLRTLAMGSGAIITSGLVTAAAGRASAAGLAPLLIGAGAMLALATMVVALTRRVAPHSLSENNP